ncbi:kinesin light chain, partial [Rhizoctonia solani AG-3 Rhs1AP]
MATDSERAAEEMVARFEGTSGMYFRFNVDQGMQNMQNGSWERLGEAMQHTKAYLQKGETTQKLEAAVRASIERRGVISTPHAAGKMSHDVDISIRLTGFKRCPAPTPFYTGREVENTQIIARITSENDKLRVCVVYGLGGSGKTQLVLSVIERTWDNWDHIIYLDASSTEAVEKGFEEFASAKNVGEGHKGVIEWLESCGERWLVVFDNADTPSTNIRQYIPARGRSGSVLITTRLPDLASLADGPDSVCRLSGMRQTDGVTLLVKIASSGNQYLSDNDTKAAEELVQDFGCLALAIVHAGAYIAHSRGMTIAEYRSLFLTQRQRMLEEYNELPVTAKHDGRGDTVYTTWRMCYDQLKPESRELLGLIAYLHYDGLSVDIFKRAAQQMHSKTYPLPLTDLESQAQNHIKQYLSTFLDSDGSWDTVKFARVMADLTSYSLIDYDRMNVVYRVHVLVHDWAKTAVSPTSRLATECAATLLSLSIDGNEDTESLAYKRQLGLHVTSMLMHNSNLGVNHLEYFKDVFLSTGQWSQAAKLIKQLLEVFQRELWDDNPKTWEAVHCLALTYINLGRYDEAEQLHIQELNACKRLLGEEHPNTLTSMNNLAMTYSDLNRWDDAGELYHKARNIAERTLGSQHPHTQGFRENLTRMQNKRQ